MLNETDIYTKLITIYRSPVDASNAVKEYSKDLLQHAIAEYDKWRSKDPKHNNSLAYFKKILQTGYNSHRSKSKENEIKKVNDSENFKRAVAKSEILHETIFKNERIRCFLYDVIQKLSDNEQDAIRARARNHLCYSKSAEILDKKINDRVKKGEKIDFVIEDLYNDFDVLLKKCMLVEMRSQLLNGNFWKEANVKFASEISFLKGV